ncbi:MAG TPA: hypothetical protein VKP30_03845, partial [Polyangiaceae bacterium]|nr:hypothetical protein [Polyangiaceae bacterium]
MAALPIDRPDLQGSCMETRQAYARISHLGGRVQALESAVVEFARGGLSAEQFRAQRVLYGIYEQRSAGTFMLRIGVPAGLIEASQLRALGQLAGEHGVTRVYLTTRQDIQIHDLSLEAAVRLSREVASSGLTSFATGGNTVRNVVADPLSGLLSDDVFDVHPYALAIASHYLALADALILPKKFKIALSASELDRAGAVVADLGFVAKLR